MKYIFLLDENILMRAIAGNPKAVNLWKLIRINCHKVASDVEGELVRNYWARLRARRKKIERSYPTFPALIGSVLQNSDKNDAREATPVSEEAYVRHQKDHYLLRILANGGGHLVTTDAQTRKDFNKPQLAKRFSIDGLTIEQAIKLASKKSG